MFSLSFHVLSWFPHLMGYLSCTKFLPPCPTRTHANRCQHQLPWAKHPRPGWNTNPPLSVRYCPTTQKKSCLDTKRSHVQKRWWDKHGFAAACQETPTLKSTKWIYTVKCESSVSKCARREILRGASVSSCQTMWSLKWDDYQEIVLTEYFLVVSVVFFVTWIHLVVYVRFNSFQNLIIQAPKPSQSPPTNYVWCKTSKPPCNSATFGNMQHADSEASPSAHGPRQNHWQPHWSLEEVQLQTPCWPWQTEVGCLVTIFLNQNPQLCHYHLTISISPYLCPIF